MNSEGDLALDVLPWSWLEHQFFAVIENNPIGVLASIGDSPVSSNDSKISWGSYQSRIRMGAVADRVPELVFSSGSLFSVIETPKLTYCTWIAKGSFALDPFLVGEPFIGWIRRQLLPLSLDLKLIFLSGSKCLKCYNAIESLSIFWIRDFLSDVCPFTPCVLTDCFEAIAYLLFINTISHELRAVFLIASACVSPKLCALFASRRTL
ncbi:hypothetical protein UM91_18380 [Pseudomonas oryzihabitans]|nr:hypothetical protein UM91_18380 [Pseudomonas oryzihabitans]